MNIGKKFIEKLKGLNLFRERNNRENISLEGIAAELANETGVNPVTTLNILYEGQEGLLSEEVVGRDTIPEIQNTKVQIKNGKKKQRDTKEIDER